MNDATTVACAICGDQFTYVRVTKARLYCSKSCRKKGATWRRPAGYENHRARAKAAGVAYAPIVKTSIYARDGWICGICGQAVDSATPWPDPMSASLDHVVPLSKGGPHLPHNVRLAHLWCNSERGAG